MARKKVERASMTQTDSKGRVTRAAKVPEEAGRANFKWWNLDEDKVAYGVADTLRFMATHSGMVKERLSEYTKLYGHLGYDYGIGSAFSRSRSVSPSGVSSRVSYNLCASIIDTLTSKIAKNKVIPVYVTNGGDWKMQKQAKLLTKFSQGLCYEQKTHEKKVQTFRASAIWGMGWTHVFRKEDRCAIEMAYPHEFFWDEVEALSSDPRQLHRVKIMDRDIAKELFPELEENIDLVEPADYQEIGGHGTAADLIKVVESWHLPSCKGAKDGARAISIGDGALMDSYEKDYFPFANLRYCKRPIGWGGQGACERLERLQFGINWGMALQQQSMKMQASFKILIENGSKVVSQHLNNEVATIINYTGTPPQYITPPAFSEQLPVWTDSLIDKGYRQEGLSALSAAAIKPMGVDSGKALRTITDIEDDRFLSIEQEIERYELEVSRQSIDVVKDIYKEKKSYEVCFPTTRFIETIDWGSIKLDEEQYVLRAYPTSSLPDDIEGRLSDVQELTQAGFISPRTAKRLMDMPDIEMNEALSNAPEDLLHKVIEEILEDGDYTPPDPNWDLQLAAQLINEYYCYAQYMNCPVDRLNLLLKFKAQIADLVGLTQPPAPAVVPGGAPLAQPAPAPVSNLLPNAPQGAA